MDFNSEHLLYKNFSEMMAESFYKFLCKVDETDTGILDGNFMSTLRNIHSVLQKVLSKNQSVPLPAEAPSLKVVKPYSNHDCPDLAKNQTIKKKKPNDCDENQKEHDLSISKTLYERAQKYLCTEIEGGDDSDCEMSVVTTKTENLFKTDYPDECFVVKTEFKNEVNYEEVSSSASNASVDCNPSLPLNIEDIPHIRRKSPTTQTPINKSNEGINDFLDDQDPYITKLAADVYICKLCSVKNLPKIHLIAHLNGRQHKNNLKVVKTEIDPTKVIEEHVIKDRPASIIVNYECTLCKMSMNSRETVMQHVNGNKHLRKLESTGTNA